MYVRINTIYVPMFIVMCCFPLYHMFIHISHRMFELNMYSMYILDACYGIIERKPSTITKIKMRNL